MKSAVNLRLAASVIEQVAIAKRRGAKCQNMGREGQIRPTVASDANERRTGSHLGILEACCRLERRELVAARGTNFE
jgi:hypothetical protein